MTTKGQKPEAEGVKGQGFNPKANARKLKRMQTAHALHQRHPEWSLAKLARALGVSRTTVHTYLSRSPAEWAKDPRGRAHGTGRTEAERRRDDADRILARTRAVHDAAAAHPLATLAELAEITGTSETNVHLALRNPMADWERWHRRGEKLSARRRTGRAPGPARKAARVAAKRERMRALRAAHPELTIAELAETGSTTVAKVKWHLPSRAQQARRQRTPERTRAEVTAATLDRVDRAHALHREHGWNAPRIARAMGIGVHTAYEYLRFSRAAHRRATRQAGGIQAMRRRRHQQWGPRRAQRAKRQARRARAARRHRDGQSVRAIAEAEGVTEQTIRRDLRAEGVRMARGKAQTKGRT